MDFIYLFRLLDSNAITIRIRQYIPNDYGYRALQWHTLGVNQDTFFGCFPDLGEILGRKAKKRSSVVW